MLLLKHTTQEFWLKKLFPSLPLLFASFDVAVVVILFVQIEGEGEGGRIGGEGADILEVFVFKLLLSSLLLLAGASLEEEGGGRGGGREVETEGW